MPLTAKGEEILANMKQQYGPERGERVFYASANKGTIEGVHQKDNYAAPKVTSNSQAAVAASTGDAEDYPTPERQPDLLGTVCEPGGIEPAEAEMTKDQDLMTGGGSAPTAGMSSSSTGMGASSTGMGGSTSMLDEAVSKKDIKSATPPMNNLSSPGNPGAKTGPLIPYSGIQVGDSLKNQNIRNRAFWARNKR